MVGEWLLLLKREASSSPKGPDTRVANPGTAGKTQAMHYKARIWEDSSSARHLFLDDEYFAIDEGEAFRTGHREENAWPGSIRSPRWKRSEQRA